MNAPGYTRDDLEQAPRWHVGPAGEAFISKGAYICVVLMEAEDGSGSVSIYSQGELIGMRGSKESAVDLAEKLVARWFPNDPAVLKPEAGPAPGTKTKDGKKFTSSNRFAAPI